MVKIRTSQRTDKLAHYLTEEFYHRFAQVLAGKVKNDLTCEAFYEFFGGCPKKSAPPVENCAPTSQPKPSTRRRTITSDHIPHEHNRSAALSAANLVDSGRGRRHLHHYA
jgi:hypothetical protein